MKYVIQIFTLMVFLNLIFYVSYAQMINFPNYFFYVALMTIVSIYYVYKQRKIYLNKGLLFWLIAYFALNTIYYIKAGASPDLFKFYVLSIVYLFAFVAMSLLYDLDDKNLTATRKSIVLALLIGVFLLLYDFTHPGYFTTGYEDIYESGRAVATYGNQNIAGAILILGLILTIDIIPRKYRIPYIIILFLGIAATVSRSNIMIYFIIIAVMSLQNKISKISLIVLSMSSILLLFWLSFFGLEFLQKNFDIKITSDVTDRLEFFVDPENASHEHTNERVEVLMAAISMFQDSPIIGNGLAATRTWDYRVGPHNSFALTWADFGLIGVLIIPLFLYFTTYQIFQSEKKEHKEIALLFILYYTFSSFFSHDMLDQMFNLCGAVIISALGYKNIYDKKENNITNLQV